MIDEIEKGCLTCKQSQVKYGIQGRSTVLIWLRKHGTLGRTSKAPVKKKAPPKTYISQLGAKIKRLEAEKEILNRAIDIADDMFHTDITKKYLSLSQQASEKQQGKNNIWLSMTENGGPHENALAERMNRTIKEEFGMDKILKNKEKVTQLFHKSIFLYNNKRSHLALQMKTPEQVYQTKIPAS